MISIPHTACGVSAVLDPLQQLVHLFRGEPLVGGVEAEGVWRVHGLDGEARGLGARRQLAAHLGDARGGVRVSVRVRVRVRVRVKVRVRVRVRVRVKVRVRVRVRVMATVQFRGRAKA